MNLWRPERVDVRWLILIAVLPVIVAMPQLLGLVDADPIHYIGQIAADFRGGRVHGMPYLDPNNGFTTQALGVRAMLDWLQGQVPWWNYYSGVGLPLAAEYQPAVFFPLTMLLLLPDGMVWLHLALQVLAGWGTYALLRQLSLGTLAAGAGGVMYGFNGTLALFAHAPALPVPFLPWMLLGIERACRKSESGQPGGWRLFAVALAMSLLGGFPETAYLSGLLALAWAVLRLFQSRRRAAFAGRVVAGGLVGIGLSAPQLLAFFEFLPNAFLGDHTGAFGEAYLGPMALIPSLVAPYVFGLFTATQHVELGGTWGIGGYATLASLGLAAYGLLSRREALGWLLLAWIVLALGKTFGWNPGTAVWNLLPGVAETAFYRYIQPSWELAVVILAAWGIDALARRREGGERWRLAAAGLFVLSVWAWAALHLRNHLPVPLAELDVSDWLLFFMAWAAVTTLLVFLVAAGGRSWRAGAIAAVLMLDSMFMLFVPTLANPRRGEVDRPAIAFLQENLGEQRFFSLGPLQANYSAMFGIASINYNYLPVDQRWVDWVKAHLYAGADPIFFNAGDPPRATGDFLKNMENYQWLGVKYVLARGGDFVAEAGASQISEAGNRAIDLAPGQEATGALPPGRAGRDVALRSVGVMLGNYGGRSDGRLAVRLCAASGCVEGSADLKRSRDNGVFRVPLDKALVLGKDEPVTYAIRRDGGGAPVALWAYPALEPQKFQTPAGALDEWGLKLHFFASPVEAVKLVYSDHVVDIFELPDPKPYFDISSGHCVLSPVQPRLVVDADCRGPATLVRRELFYPGWRARIDGRDAGLAEHAGLFQAVDLPPGRSRVEFSYSPPHVAWAWLVMAVSAIVLVLPPGVWRKKAKGAVHA